MQAQSTEACADNVSLRISQIRAVAPETLAETVAEIPLVAAQGVERLSLGQIWLSLVRTLCGAT